MEDGGRVQVRLSKAEQQQLDKLLRGGLQPVRTVLRALVLRQLADGQAIRKVARNVGLTPKTVWLTSQRYQQGGLERALYEGGAAGERSAVGCTAAAHRGPGLRSTAGGPGAVDGALASGGSSEAQAGATGGTRDGPSPARKPRPETVAGKKCGAWPNSMRNISRAWRLYWPFTKSRSRHANRWCVSTSNRWGCMRKSGLRWRCNPDG